MSQDDSLNIDSKRIRKFRNDLVRVIPRIPNDRHSLKALHSKSLTTLLLIYMCWRMRNVAIRPRTVTGLSALENDHRANTLKANIDRFVKLVEAGGDLGPHLSRKAHVHGYVMASDPDLVDVATWNDKDFVLNAMGLHHFHLGRQVQTSGLTERTNEVLFAFVTRDTLEILGLFDHSAFDSVDDGTMTPEQERLWSVRDSFIQAGTEAGAIFLDGYGGLGITTAGTPVVITIKSSRQAAIIRDIDPKLDDLEYVRTLFAGYPVPTQINFEWHYQDMDFGLLNKTSGHFIVFMRGPN